MQVFKYSTINDIKDLWDHFVAGNNICLSSNFLSIIEELHPEDKFVYYIIRNNDKIVCICFFCIKKYILPVCGLNVKFLMTGTFETYGKHYWYDSANYSEIEALNLIVNLAKKERHSIIIVRDFLNKTGIKLSKWFESKMFEAVKISDLSVISLANLSENLNNKKITFDSYLSSLKKKHRNHYKKILKYAEFHNYKIEYTHNYGNYIEELHALYLLTNKRAEEHKTEPISIKFLELTNKLMSAQTGCIILRTGSDEIIGFILCFETDKLLVPFLMGGNTTSELHVWHTLTLNAIKYAIESNKEEVDLGITNSSMKKRLSANSIPLIAYAQFKNKVVNFMFKRLIKKIILG